MLPLLAALLLGQPQTSITARQGKSLDGGFTAWAVDCINCSGGGGPASSVSITGQVAINILDAGAPLNVNPISGAATSAKQDTGNTSLSSIDGKTATLVAGRTPVDPSGVTSPISAAALPLPSGAATGAKQDTGNASLSSIDGKLPALVLGKVPVDATCTVVGQALEATQLLVKAKTDNLDVALSTRTKPADQQHVIIDTIPSTAVTGPLTDTQLRAVPVPVSGTVTASGPLTDAQLRASAVPISLATAPTTPITATALPLPVGAATDSTLSQLLDGGMVQLGRQADGAARAQLLTDYGVQWVISTPAPFGARTGALSSLPCNAIRRTNCR